MKPPGPAPSRRSVAAVPRCLTTRRARALLIAQAALAALALPAAPSSAQVLLAADGEPVERDPRVERATSMEELSPALLPPSSGAWWSTGASLEVAAAGALPLAQAIDRAAAARDDFEPERALEILAAAVRGAPGAAQPIDRAQYVAACELWGLAAQEATEPEAAAEAYRRLLAVAPSHELTALPGSGYEVLWGQVRREVLAGTTATLSIQHGDEVWWDGEPVSPEDAATGLALHGWHLLQWRVLGALQGAWVRIEDGTEQVSLVAAAYAPDLLARGLTDAGAQHALRTWLPPLFDGQAVVVVQEREPLRGFLASGTVRPWALGLEGIALRMDPDRVRLAVAGGYAVLVEPLQVGGESVALRSSYASLDLAVDIKAVGPLHVRVEGDLLVSEPARLGDSDVAVTALLPGFLLGAAMHPQRGALQPWGSVSAGLWVAPVARSEDQRKAAAEVFVDPAALEVVEARGAVQPRFFAEGGVDLIPRGGPVVVRIGGGVGAGYGFEARARVGLGVRFGR